MTNKASTKTETRKPPVAKLRHALNTATIWERTVGDKTFYSVSFERRYKDKDGNWQSTQNFGLDDLLSIAHLAEQAEIDILNRTATA